MDKNLVPVDPAKLSQGLKTTFLGVSLIFDSLGASGTALRSFVNDAQTTDAVAEALDLMWQAEKRMGDAEAADKPAEAVPAESAPGKPAEAVSDTPAADASPAPAAGVPGITAQDKPVTAADQPTPEKQAAPSVTVDDITKVIVAKIKKKRSNNEAIGKLLKAYGAAKVSELDPAKYEAFLTDISQL